jgi:leader peptidase (prepilin peptidase)/N-methyltransferase
MFDDFLALLSTNFAFLTATVFILGLVIGSFLNVVIYRLPIMLEREWRQQAADFDLAQAPPTPDGMATPAGRLTLSFPRSACPACAAPIGAIQNIPVISWLMLKGRCARCKVRISWRYPVIELATGLLSVWVVWHFGVGASAACALAITWSLVALTGIDLDHQLLPDDITLPLLWAALLASVVTGGLPGATLPVSPADAIIGAASGYLSLWAVFHAFRFFTGKEGMGYGDFKLLAALGAWLGWKMLPLVLLLSASVGAVVGIAMVLFRGRDRAAPMPFGPYLAAAGWIAMLYGDTLVSAYLRLSGLHR